MKDITQKGWTYGDVNKNYRHKRLIDPYNDLWLPLLITDCMLILQNRGVTF